MKKIVLFLLCFGILSLCGCGLGQDAEITTDELFLEEFKNGLMARWNIVMQSSGSMEDALEAELEHISSFSTKSFEDQHLQEIARAYISSVNEQKEALAYEHVDYYKYTQLFQRSYNKRTVLIKQICEEYNIQFPQKYDEAINSILQSSSAAEIQIGMDDAIQEMLDNAEVRLVDGTRKWKEYSVFVKNESKYDIPNFQIQVQIYDQDYVALDTCYCDSIKLLRAGESARVTFSTDKDFTCFILYATHY